MKLQVGFIGLGLMGSPMARNILNKGFPLHVYNRDQKKTDALVSLGAKRYASPADLTSSVDIVITMVTSGKDVNEVLFQESGVVSKGKKGLIVIDMSTIGPSYAKKISKELARSGIDFLDAPVTGSTPKAASGELTIFVGGKREILEKAREVLEAMGKNIVYVGPSGSGQAVKLINNYIIAASIQALSESMILSEGMGVPRETVARALEATPNISPSIQNKLQNLVHDTFPLLFTLANMRKDLGLARFEMRRTGKKLDGIICTEKLFARANKDIFLTKQDFSAIIKELERQQPVTQKRK